MSRTHRKNRAPQRRERRIRVRSVRRDPVDVRKLSRAVIVLAQAQAEADAAAANTGETGNSSPEADA